VNRSGGRGRSSTVAAKQVIVLVFGEDENDREALRELIVALCPELESRIETRHRPLVLLRDASPTEIPDRASQIADAVAADRVRRDVRCVFAHQDCDDVEPSHEAVARRIEEALARAGCPAHAVTPAWEIEAWWFMWPSAVRAYQSSWNIPRRYSGTSVGLIVNAKEEFRRATRAAGKRKTREYRESDSPPLAKKVREMGLARTPEAKSLSYERFVGSVDSCCKRIGSEE
jgi:hypothetical protein